METKASKLSFFQLIIFLLSVYVIVVMILQAFMNFSDEMNDLMLMIDTSICCVFIVDFVANIITAENKKRYLLRYGLIDFVASIPTFGVFRLGRLSKIVRILRMVKAARSINDIINETFEKKGEGIFKSVILFSVLLLIISSIVILYVEKGVGEINTAEDAFWWTTYTLMGMDYCNPPVSFIGKIIATLLALAGMTLLGSFTAYLAEIFFNDKK